MVTKTNLTYSAPLEYAHSYGFDSFSLQRFPDSAISVATLTFNLQLSESTGYFALGDTLIIQIPSVVTFVETGSLCNSVSNFCIIMNRGHLVLR